MTELTFLTKPTVSLINFMGGDASVVRSARVSVEGDNNVNSLDEKGLGLINYLMREKHGSPFEHNAMTFFVKAPIFVFREFHRHRVGFSYNEMSGRYTKLEPEFFVPGPERPLVNVGTSARPEMAPGSEEDYLVTRSVLEQSAKDAWARYEVLLARGVAKEVAREVLPVNIASQMFVTCNARSLMNFLSLRTHEPEAAHVSRPQYEIEQVAREMEAYFATAFPGTHACFDKHGRVAP